MSGKGHRHRGGSKKPGPTLASVARETAMSLPAESPVLAMFKTAASKLNDRQDRHERLVKLSRDITIESKRIIFLLHSAIKTPDTEKAVQEANVRLTKLIMGPIKSIGLELEHSPAYLHSRAVTSGFQEFIEALTLCHLIEHRELISWKAVQDQFQYTVTDKTEEDTPVERQVVTLLTQSDFLLGIADLTGELMRRAINSISSGDSEECFFACNVVRQLYSGYLGLSGINKELSRKMSTTKANVFKVEAAVYALRVRGGEAPPAMIVQPGKDWEPQTSHSDDEGYY